LSRAPTGNKFILTRGRVLAVIALALTAAEVR
jgi:hypothetical protein